MYTLSIEDIVKFLIKFELKVGDGKKTFKFHMIAKRVEQSVISGWISEGADTRIKDILKDVVTGWDGQTLVMDGDEPAKFNDEAFDVLLGLPGVANLMFTTYLKESVAKEKN